ncbi:hypothetical protein CLF_101945 [Clonorchis sinensis]|uniref:Uncharacterized protein n=1 Tax=Clonorchis sinensis TaxID=79923 RepID=G7Y6X8_CLOSI|nr:hypothetical protein CLF_101945 [Clonorchis sinensis]
MRLMKQLRQKKIAVRMRIKQGVRGTQLDCTLLKYHNSALEETLLNKMDKTELDRATDELTRTLRAFERAVATLRKKREEVFRRTQEFKKETCWQKQLEEHYHRYKLPSINMAIENNRESLQLTKELKKRKRQMRIEKHPELEAIGITWSPYGKTSTTDSTQTFLARPCKVHAKGRDDFGPFIQEHLGLLLFEDQDDIVCVFRIGKVFARGKTTSTVQRWRCRPSMNPRLTVEQLEATPEDDSGKFVRHPYLPVLAAKRFVRTLRGH